MNNHPRDGERGNERQRTFEKLLIRGVVEQVAADGTDRKRGQDARVDRARELPVPGLPQIRETDGNNQEGFESFPQSDDKGL